LKTLLGILPWAIVLAIGGVAIWFMLDRQMAAGRWLLAGLLLGHGLVHVLYLVPAPAAGSGDGPQWPFDLGRGRLTGSLGLDPGLVRAGAIVVIAVVVLAFALGALATVGILVPVDWWAPLVVVGAIASLVLLVLAFHPQLVLGIGIDVALLVVVLGSLWSPAAT
jgi:hypothetical protein